MKRLSGYSGNRAYSKMECETWTDFFNTISPLLKYKKVVLYFEEIQWLASYDSEFLPELKPFWDDQWRHYPGLRIIFCGSSPSFIVGEFISNKALYSRSQHDIHLSPFNLNESSCFINKAGHKEVMLSQLTVGGIPEYLKKLKNYASVYLSLCEHSFKRNSYFLEEKEKIFVSHLKNNKHYESIIKFLAGRKCATRKEIQKYEKIHSGGSLSLLLHDLEQCHFIEKYVPLHLKRSSLLARYTISDAYLQFYFNHIEPNLNKIEEGRYTKDVTKALSSDIFQKSMGFAFERWCRRHSLIFAKILGFDKIDYQSGSWFSRKTDEMKKGFQIDLIFIRADYKVLICEIKYYAHLLSAKSISNELEGKKQLFKESNQKYKNYSFENILITTEGLSEDINNCEYLDHVITFDDIFNPQYW